MPSCFRCKSISKYQIITRLTFNFIGNISFSLFQPPPPLYIITPTYRRPEQLAELTRLGYTLKHIANLYWLVIEDAEEPTPQVTKLLQKINVPFAHLVGNYPHTDYGALPRLVNSTPPWWFFHFSFPPHSAKRKNHCHVFSFVQHHSHSIATSVITFLSSFSSSSISSIAQMPAKYRKNKVKPRGVSNRNRGLEWIRANASDGVLYFADDDNTYDVEIFDEVRIVESLHILIFLSLSPT